MIKTVLIPAHVSKGITRNHKGHPATGNLHIFGADTETYHGYPHAIQLATAEGANLEYVKGRDALPTFVRMIYPHVRSKKVNVCYVHNLNFDLPVLFWGDHEEFYEQHNDIELWKAANGTKLPRKWYEQEEIAEVLKIKILFGKVNAAKFEWGRHYLSGDEAKFETARRLLLYDSMAFTHASLSRSLTMFHIPEVKMEAPKGLGTKRIKGEAFEKYAIQDAVAVRALGLKIMEIHDRYAVRPSVSLPQFAGRVFRHHFMGAEDLIKFPPEECQKAAELSYHGGKNGFYGLPGLYPNCVEVDINSAYPAAMAQLPDMIHGDYVRVNEYRPGMVGIFCLSGKVDPRMKYPLIFDHKFKRVDGDFKDVWTTGYETALALECPEIIITASPGWAWAPGVVPKDFKNPFTEYVNNFYKLKETTPKDDPNYNFYKLALNSLYGKFVGTVERHHLCWVANAEGDEMLIRQDFRWDSVLEKYVQVETDHIAGGLYNPFVATLITGYVRAVLWGLETKYQALHSSTDSIKTVMPIEEVPGLGGWKKEVQGPCYIFRNKLYLHYDAENSKPGVQGLSHEGHPLRKFAMHGFKGKLKEYHDAREALLRDGGLIYKYQHVVGLREGLKRKERPGDFVMREEFLSLTKRG